MGASAGLPIQIATYVAASFAIWLSYFLIGLANERRSRRVQAAALEAGLAAPASLHPVIDPARCLGCGACTRACPEGDVLGLVRGKAVLIEPAECIGHGACQAACPRDAISLVFGTAERGVDIPFVGPDFQTNVPGIYIAGELGGMGLIRNAIEQGRQAVEAIGGQASGASGDALDLVVVGAGPAGFAASLAAIEKGMRFVTIEQDSFGGTVAHFPRGKLVMTAPAELPLIGRMPFKEVGKERMLEFWQAAARKTGLKVNYGERVVAVSPAAGGFVVATDKARYATRTVLLAAGRRGTPRRLDVPGEELAKVVYRLSDAAEYRGKHCLVVGGGDSALEAAGALAGERGTNVTLSYRGTAFGRAKAKNRQRFDAARKAGRLTALLNSKVVRIADGTVEIDCAGRLVRLRNDAVIVCAGGILPTDFLKATGIDVETKYGTR